MYVIDHADVCFFFYVNSRFENFLQRQRKTGSRTRECIFRASGGTNFEHFSGFGIDGCAILPNVNIYIYIYYSF